MTWSRRSTAFVVSAVLIAATVGLLWSLSGSRSEAVGVLWRGLVLGALVGVVTMVLSFGRPTAKRLAASTLGLSRAYLVPGEVPPPPTFFVGRQDKLDEAVGILRPPRAAGHRRRPFILLIHGEAGVGKSGFALKVAASVAGDFRDGVVYASMTGAKRDSERLHNVLGDLVDSLQGPGDEVPATTAARRAELGKLSRRKRRRVLFVLDDVLDAAAAEAVLPASSNAVVLITSRSRLDLKGPIEKRELPPLRFEDSEKLLRSLLGDPEPEEASNEAISRVVASAAGYPLALHLAARAISNQGLWALPEITANLPESEVSDVREAQARMLDLSFNVLSPLQQTVLLSLAWLPEPTFVPWMAQALAGLDNEDDAWIICERLADERLLERITPDATGVIRLRMPDRVAAYVETRVAKESTEADAARTRQLLESARARRRPRDLGTVLETLNEGHVARALDEARGALADVTGVEGAVGATQSNGLAARRAYAMIAEILGELGGLDDAMEIATTHLQLGDEPAATKTADVAEAQLRRSLGRLLRRAWKLETSVKELTAAYEVATALGQVDEQISSLRELAIVQSMRTDKPDNHIERAHQTLTTADGLLDQATTAGYLSCRLREARAMVRLNDVNNHGPSPYQLRTAVQELEQAIEDLPAGYVLWQAWFGYHKARVLIRQADDLERSTDADPESHDSARRLRTEARRLAQTAMDAFSNMAHRYGAARCRLEIGRTYAHERPTAALPLLEEARETFFFCGDRWIEAQTALVLAQVRTRIGKNIDEADAELDFAQNVFAAVRDQAHLTRVKLARAALASEVRR